MATYSTSLKLTLIGDGEQSGTWGQTTNSNLGTLLEQAITGVTSITMVDANYTLTDLNGVSDEARNAVLVIGGTNSAQRDVIAPSVNKLYVVKNNTSGGYAIRIKTSSGIAVTVPNGVTTTVYCDGTDFYETKTGTANSFSIGGNATVGGTLGVTGAVNGTTGSFSGDVTFPTQSAGNNTTKAATTAFVTTAVSNATGSLGTMSTQNANSVSITGGSITGITDLAIADGGTGASTASAAFANLKQDATTTATGVVELATSAEASAGTDTTRAITPATLRDGFNATGSAPVYAARAWVCFNGTTSPATIRGSANVSSVSYDGGGGYTVNFTTAMPDANYAVAVTGNPTANAGNSYYLGFYEYSGTRTTSKVSIGTGTAPNSYPQYASLAIFRQEQL